MSAAKPTNFGDNPIMLEASAALGRSHAERGFEPYWQGIFPQRAAAYIRAYNARKAEIEARAALFPPCEGAGE